MKHDVSNARGVEVCLYNIVFYTAERGDSPLDDFLDGLDKKSRAKVAAYLSRLEEQGPNLKRPYADIAKGKIRELRIQYSSNQFRLLYFFQMFDQIVLVHALSKKTQQLRKQDIELAEKLMEDWIRRFPAGGEK
ncbi:MAG: type II toxin-antitoxin system RelE/ParE family toxin [Syntrophus sp. (in: bacteria)]|nr:type II toxin-antitoxin system RelE/ParE family toxin [Syntrophus sp. (in: bacteria)]